MTSCFYEIRLLDRKSEWKRLTARAVTERGYMGLGLVDSAGSWIFLKMTSCFYEIRLLDRKSEWKRLTASAVTERGYMSSDWPIFSDSKVFVLIIEISKVFVLIISSAT